MMKRLLCILLCLATVLPFAACDNYDPADELLTSMTESFNQQLESKPNGETESGKETESGTTAESGTESKPDSESQPATNPDAVPQPCPIAVIKDEVIYLFEGDSQALRFSTDANGATNPRASDIVWTASPECVKVENGTVTALKQGYAYVSGGGDTGCMVRIVPKDMPEMNIDAGGAEIVRDPANIDRYYDCSISLIAKSNAAFNLTNESAGIRVRGNSTSRAEKKPYRIKFSSKQNLLGMNAGEKFKSWVLLSDPYDDSMIRNTTALTLASYVVDNYSADWRYVKLTLNGEYQGVYVLTEQSQINEGRIEISEAGGENTDVMSGYLFEMDSSPLYQGGPYREGKIVLSYEDWYIKEYHKDKEFVRSTNDEGTRDVLISIKNDDLTVEQRAFVEKYMQNVFKILYFATQQGIYYEFDANYDLVEVKNTDSKTTLLKVFDLESWVRMYIHSELVCNGDQSKKSFYMWVDFSEDGTGLLNFGCPWDFDSAFCGYKSYTFQKIEYIFAAKRNLWYVMVANCMWFREEVCRVWEEVYESSNGFQNASYVLDNIVKYYKDEIDEDARIWKRTHDHEEYAIKTRVWVEEHSAWLNTQFDLTNQKSVWLYP